jgi:hypothetical protein
MADLYFRASIDRQTIEDQFEDLLLIAERRLWARLEPDQASLRNCVEEHHHSTGNGGTRTVCRIQREIAAEFSQQWVYVEQEKSGKR